MSRIRISTTVDGEMLARCRAAVGSSDSEMLDRALEALLDQLETERERAILRAMPYDSDPDVSWEAPPIPSLRYDGEVPEDVAELARRRRDGAA